MWSKLNYRKFELNLIHEQIINSKLDLNTKFILIKAALLLLVGNFEGHIRECYEQLYFVIKEKEIDVTKNELFLVKCISYSKSEKKEKEIVKKIKSYLEFNNKNLEMEKFFNKNLFLKDYGDVEDIYILFEFFIFKYFTDEFYSKSSVVSKIVDILERNNIETTNLCSFGKEEIYKKNLSNYILTTLTQIKDLNTSRNFIAHGDSSERALFNLKMTINQVNFEQCIKKYENFRNITLFLMELLEFYIDEL